MSDARALSHGAVDQQAQQGEGLPPEAQGELFSPARRAPDGNGGGGGKEASSRQQQQPSPQMPAAAALAVDIMAAFGAASAGLRLWRLGDGRRRREREGGPR